MDQPTPLKRALSLAELALGAFIVIGHNIFHIVPNEVPVLFVLGWLSLRLRNGAVAPSGPLWLVPSVFKRPQSWWTTIAIAVPVAILMQLDSIVVDPIAAYFFPEPADLSSFKPLVGNVGFALQSLALIWTFAAFGEELSYRGYLTRRAADLGDNTTAAWWIGMVLVAVLFGLGHWYKGPAGVLDSTLSGLILGGAYLLSGRNLWVTILAHGLSDTIAVGIVFFGLVDV